MFSSMQYYPGTEELLPDEMRVTFMGTSPAIREDQSGMSIFVELGNGDTFIFDLGTGSLKNYMARGVPLMNMNNIPHSSSRGSYRRLAVRTSLVYPVLIEA